MARDLSKQWQTAVNSDGATLPVLMLEIAHVGLSEPIRVVNDTQDLPHVGNTFRALRFKASLPSEPEQGLPYATLTVDNVGRELTQWLDTSNGGEGATVRMIQVLRDDPDTVQWEVTLDLRDVKVNMTEVAGRLGYDDILNRVGIPMTYRSDTAPGLF